MREIRLNQFSRSLGYTFQNTHLLEKALTHRSFAGRENNERLEFLGDAILNFVIAEALFIRFETCAEGELTRLRASLVKGETLAEVALEMNLGDMMHFGSGELSTGGFRRHSTLEDAFEALLGAIYLDSDFLQVKTLILTWFESRLSRINIDDIPRDYKTRLQEYLQAKSVALPFYTILEESGPDHAKVFKVRCEVSALSVSCEAIANSKKSAEQGAAQKVLEQLLS